MKNQVKFVGLLLFLALKPIIVLADIERAQLTSAVENKEPVDDLGNLVFGRLTTIEKVFYFTHITGMAHETLTHRWLLNEKLVAEVELTIGSDSWRTYSSKRIAPSMSGNWRVEAWHGEQLLTSHDFVYEVANR